MTVTTPTYVLSGIVPAGEEMDIVTEVTDSVFRGMDWHPRVDPSCEWFFNIVFFHDGKCRWGGSDSRRFPARAWGPKSISSGIQFSTLARGDKFTIRVENTTDEPRLFMARISGKAIP